MKKNIDANKYLSERADNKRKVDQTLEISDPASSTPTRKQRPTYDRFIPVPGGSEVVDKYQYLSNPKTPTKKDFDGKYGI